VMKKAVYRALDKNLMRRNLMMRLHIFPEEDIPEEVKANISHQIPVLRPVPRSLLTYTDEEIANFPKVVDYPEGYVVK
ncbi:54S ribosomal protein L13, partial [Homalodisca vitripennis]